MITPDQVRQIVYDQIEKVAEENKKTLAPLSDQLILLESGLDSLCIAILVANLDDELGVDPFGSGDDVMMPVTLGDFVQIYQDAAA